MHVVVIGNGVAGITAAIRLRERRPDWRITIVSGESTHHWSRPALMYLFMGHMTWADVKPYEDGYWAEQRLDLVRDWVTGIDVAAKRLHLHRGGPLAWDRLLVATGSKSNRFGWPGQDLAGVQGLWDLMDLRLLHENVARTRRAVLVGGGLIGIELAEMLHSRGVSVTLLVREASYWGNVLPREEGALVHRVIREAGLGLRLSTTLREIVDDGTGLVTGAVTGDGERIDCELVGLTAGVSPNVDLLRDGPIAIGRGVLVDRSLRTSVPDVWAAGDCAEIVTGEGERNLVQQVWYTGRAQGRVVADAIAGDDVVYEPAAWFNSAKFLDLEFQTYGTVPGAPAPGEKRFWWQDEAGRRGVRLVERNGALTGVNVLGMRWRQTTCERWIRDRLPVSAVLDRLDEARFDPELFDRPEPGIAAAMRQQLGSAEVAA